MQEFRVLLVLILLSAAAPVGAAPRTFVDEEQFRAALSGAPRVIDFEEFPDQMHVVDEAYGITFDPYAYVIDMTAPGLQGTYHTPNNAILNWDSFAGSPIHFSFDEPVYAFGLYNTSWLDQVRLRLYDTEDNLVYTGYMPEGPVNFLGYVSDVPIARGEAVGYDMTYGFIVLDTLMFSTQQPVANESDTFSAVKTRFTK